MARAWVVDRGAPFEKGGYHASSAYSKPRLVVSLNKPKVCSMPFVRGAKPRRIVPFEILIAFDPACFDFTLYGLYNDRTCVWISNHSGV